MWYFVSVSLRVAAQPYYVVYTWTHCQYTKTDTDVYILFALQMYAVWQRSCYPRERAAEYRVGHLYSSRTVSFPARGAKMFTSCVSRFFQR